MLHLHATFNYPRSVLITKPSSFIDISKTCMQYQLLSENKKLKTQDAFKKIAYVQVFLTYQLQTPFLTYNQAYVSTQITNTLNNPFIKVSALPIKKVTIHTYKLSLSSIKVHLITYTIAVACHIQLPTSPIYSATTSPKNPKPQQQNSIQ